MKKDKNVNAFLALVRAGLWEKDVQLSPIDEIAFDEVLQLANEQSVIGLVAAGLEHVTDIKIPKKELLQIIGQTMRLEQNNIAMNYFIGVLIDKMKTEGIHSVLVKGQGIAQCYERPLWRSCGDVDLLFSDDNYSRAKVFLTPLASIVEDEGMYSKHLGMKIDPWVVELHGSMRCGLSNRMDKELNELFTEVFAGGNVRSWINGKSQVLLLGVNHDIVYVFVHILSHFYKGGIGLRQFCDWCRLLWKHHAQVNVEILERRLKMMGLLTEWKAFGAFAVMYLGMPADAMPLYSEETRWIIKAERVCSFVMEVGNFGHNRDWSYFDKYPYLVRKAISFSWRCRDLIRHAWLFPMDSLRFFPNILINGLKAAARGV